MVPIAVWVIHDETLLHLDDLLEDIAHVLAHTERFELPLRLRGARSALVSVAHLWRGGVRPGVLQPFFFVLVLQDDSVDVDASVSPARGH
jgi:hypothetical protein